MHFSQQINIGIKTNLKLLISSPLHFRAFRDFRGSNNVLINLCRPLKSDDSSLHPTHAAVLQLDCSELPFH